MKRDLFTKCLLSAITVLLVINLLVSLRAVPSKAQQAQGQPPCQVVITDPSARDIGPLIEEQEQNGYHLKGITANNEHFVAVLER